MPKADRLSPGAVKLLQEKQLAHLATTMADGSPQVTPVWIDVAPDGSYLLINTAEGRVKTRNMSRNPNVAISVVDNTNPYRLAVIRGTIVERRHEGADQDIDNLARKYLGQEKYPWRNPAQQRVTLIIKPTHIVERGTE
jgi:PPOX class probable F420-dependent enzyme